MILFYALILLTMYREVNDPLHVLASAILHNIDNAADKSLDELATLCSSNKSNMHRFITRIGYQNYHLFKSRLSSMTKDYSRNKVRFTYTEDEEADCELFTKKYIDLVKSIEELNSYEDFSQFADKIMSSKKITVIGSPLPQGLIFLNMELTFMHIECNFSLFPKDQEESMKSIDKETTLLVIDANYEDSLLRTFSYQIDENNYPHVMMITPKKHAHYFDPELTLKITDYSLGANNLACEYIVWKLLMIIKRRRNLAKQSNEINDDVSMDELAPYSESIIE